MFNSKNISDKISYELVNVSYDIEKELSKNSDNIEYESYKEELETGKYRDMKKIFDSFSSRGIEQDKV